VVAPPEDEGFQGLAQGLKWCDPLFLESPRALVKGHQAMVSGLLLAELVEAVERVQMKMKSRRALEGVSG
jgi:hypothetical protein